jgi:hypothetical protein
MEVLTKMKKLITLMLLGAALAVPAATAAPTKGKPSGPKPCHGKAMVMVVLKGTLANQPVAGDTSFQLTVLHTNRWGRGYKLATQPVTINVAANTRYVKGGAAATIDKLTLNDALVVKGKLSRCALRDADPASMPALTAKMVVDQTGSMEDGS